MKMSEKITTLASKWKDFFYIAGFLLTCFILVGNSNSSWGKQGEINSDIEKRVEKTELKSMRQDTLNAKFIKALDDFSANQLSEKAANDLWRKNWQIEHIRLMKLHKLYPEDWNIK
jgi:hypothetical protein